MFVLSGVKCNDIRLRRRHTAVQAVSTGLADEERDLALGPHLYQLWLTDLGLCDLAFRCKVSSAGRSASEPASSSSSSMVVEVVVMGRRRRRTQRTMERTIEINDNKNKSDGG